MNWSILLTICGVCSLALAGVQVDICHPDTLDPYLGTDVMIGSRLSVVVSSTHANIWSGGFFIEGDDRDYGTLLGRVKDPNSRDWMQSHLPAAGLGAQVSEWRDSIRWGFDLYTDDVLRQSGKWFVVDYEAVESGPCTVYFYDYGRSWTLPDPNQTVVFHNVPTRDLVVDGIVNYADFSLFSSQWLHYTGTGDPNLLSPADFNLDGAVDFVDVCLFADFWMYGVPGWQPTNKNVPPPHETQPEPKTTYSIVDADGLSEITLTAGQSITLYILKASEDEEIQMIDLAVLLSDPNLGWIDNTPIDPNNPPGPGTARLLFEPRHSFFDYWGPGLTQLEGIEFIGVDFTSPVADGLLASFVYTAVGEGTMQLNIADLLAFSKSTKLVIHQVAEEQEMLSAPESNIMFAGTTESETAVQTASLPETTAVTSSEPAPTPTNEQMADFLEDIYENDQNLQQQVNPDDWDEFVENVRNSE